MKVVLLAHTPNPEEIIAAAGRGCYSVKPSSELMNMNNKEMKKTLDMIHGSVLEHVSFTFSVEGVSRVLSHQLVRHRIASFSQQSMRYVDVHKLWDHIVIPKTVADVQFEEFCFADTISEQPMTQKIEAYENALHELMLEMDKHKILSEDQRYFVPNGVMTNITLTMNLRELQHFFGLRRCKRAQWEIREMANKMAELIESECPVLTNHINLGPQCEQTGRCPEHKGCGRQLITVKEAEESHDAFKGERKDHTFFGKFQKVKE